MKIKILGICGSPVKEGNTALFLEEALKTTRETAGVETSTILLSEKNISDCQHCNWCLKGQKEGQFCKLKDDMNEIYPLLLEADGLLLASPVYFGRLSGRLANFIDRLRVFIHGNYYRHQLKDKVGSALAVSWFRDRGGETTLFSIDLAFSRLDMLIVPGVTSISSPGSQKEPVADDKLIVLRDKYGLNAARRSAARMVEIIRMVKLGKEALDKETNQ